MGKRRPGKRGATEMLGKRDQARDGESDNMAWMCRPERRQSMMFADIAHGDAAWHGQPLSQRVPGVGYWMRGDAADIL